MLKSVVERDDFMTDKDRIALLKVENKELREQYERLKSHVSIHDKLLQREIIELQAEVETLKASKR